MQSYNLEIWDSVEQQWKHLVSCNSTSYNVQVSSAVINQQVSETTDGCTLTERKCLQCISSLRVK